MALNPLSTWKSTYQNLGTADNQSTGIENMANWIDGQVTGKLVINPSMVSQSSFTWQKATFISSLSSLQPNTDPTSPTRLAMAWEVSVLASMMMVPSGAYSGAPAPPTTWAAPPVSIILPPSIVVAKAAMMVQLLSLAPLDSYDDVKIPEILRTAFLTLQVSVTGLNMLPPPAGPLPLVMPTTTVT